jgi:uncharacterized protein (TIGR02757 family)
MEPMSATQQARMFLACERIYQEYHSPEFIHPDPLEIPRRYTSVADRELVAFVSSVFALGRVELILSFLNRIFEKFPSPSSQLAELSREEIEAILGGLRYRFFDSRAVSTILKAVSSIQSSFGSLEAVYTHGGLSGLRNELVRLAGPNVPAIGFPNPEGIAKRLHLFLRWVVRSDSVDLGLWDPSYTSNLVYPLDTHIFRTGVLLGITTRKGPDLRARDEITHFFRQVCPQDPVRYDFSLSRIGLGKDLTNEEYKIAVLKFFD